MKTTLKILFLLLLLSINSCTLFNIDDREGSLTQYQVDSLYLSSDSLRTKGRDYREKSDFASALEAQTKAIEISLLLKDTMNIIKDYNQLGTTFRRIGRLEQALNSHYQALNYVEICATKDSVDWLKNSVITLNGIGNLHLTLGNAEMAERYFRKALEGEFALNSKIGLAINYANLGSILQSRNELDSALFYYEKSMEYNKLAGSDMGIGLCHVHFGSVFEAKDSLEEAESEYRIAAQIMNDIDDKWHSIEPLIALSSNLRKQNKLTEAEAFADRSLAIAREIHSYEALKNTSYQKAELLDAKGDYKGALEYYRISNAWNDSLGSSSINFGDLCIAYEQMQSKRDFEALEKAYKDNDKMHDLIFWIELALLLISLISLHLLWYAARNRKIRIETLKNLDELKNTFFRNITHEFRTPLTVITGLAEQLKAEEIEPTQRIHFLNSIKQQGNKLLELVSELLSLSKLMAGDSTYKWAHGDVVAFIRMSIANYTDFAKTRNTELVFSSSQPKIEMDFVPEFFDKIIANLISNAFKFTPSGGSITIKTELRDSHLVLDVIDTGVGISNQDLPHVFELFYHGHESQMQGSSGIGLPFVKQMIHQMGGIITAKHNDPKGTIIEAILSTKCNDENAEISPWMLSEEYERMKPESLTLVNQALQNESLSSNSEFDSANQKELPLVLIVEDNPDVGEYVSLLLRSKYRIATACDGYDALNKVKQLLPDIVITDLMMPGMDGFELCNILRQSSLYSDLPLIIISARSAEKNNLRSADAYLVKPFNPKELELLIIHFLEQRRQQTDKIQLLLSSSISANDSIDEKQTFLRRLIEITIKQIMAGDCRLEAIAQKMNMSFSDLKNSIESDYSMLSSTFIMHVRLFHAVQLMKNKTVSVENIALDCGFEDYQKFAQIFKQHFGISPKQFQ